MLCICKIRRRYQKWFKAHFSVRNWCLSQTEWRKNVMHSAGHRKIINNIKRFVRILLKTPTQKISRKHTSKISKEKKSFLYEQFLIEWKIIFITLSDLPWMLLFLLRTYVTCVMGATLMLRWHMDEKAPYMPVFAVVYDNHCFRAYKKGFTFTVATRYICFHVYC